MCRVAILGFSRLGSSVGRSLHRQIILSEIKYHYFHPLLSFPHQSSFPRRRESRKHRFYSEKTKSKAQTCGLIQRISQRLPHCIKSELVLNLFSHLQSKLFIPYKHFTLRLLLFLSLLSFLRPLSFLRRQESSKHFVPLTAIRLWVQGVYQKKHPLGVRKQEPRPTLDSRFHGNDRVWSFLRQLSFPRRRESRMLLSSDTAWFSHLVVKLSLVSYFLVQPLNKYKRRKL